MVSGFSTEQISLSLDRDAAQVVKRVPGITITDNNFLQIRGLAPRYLAKHRTFYLRESLKL